MAIVKLEKYSKQLGTLANYVNSKIIRSIIEKDQYKNEPYKFFYTLLFKINNGLDSANLLIVNIHKKPHYSDSILLLLRTLLSDVITLDYMLTQSRGKDIEFNKQIENVYYDHITYTEEKLETFKCLYKENEEDIEKKRKELETVKRKYFDSSGELKEHLKKLKSIPNMVKIICKETSRNTPLDYLTLAYEHYDIFSKLEHLGELTSVLSLRPFNKPDEIIKEIMVSIDVILHYQQILIRPFFSEGTTEMRELKSLKRKFQSFTPR